MHELTILGDRAPCHVNALPRQNFGNLAVADGFGWRFVPDHFLSIERIAVAEQAPPSAVATWLEKKYLSSKMPRGVSMYLLVVTREIVDSCMLTASAMSCSTNGFIASGPWSKNARWRSTIVRATLSNVSLRLFRL